jgi:hypothetical protein
MPLSPVKSTDLGMLLRNRSLRAGYFMIYLRIQRLYFFLSKMPRFPNLQQQNTITPYPLHLVVSVDLLQNRVSIS